VGAGNDADRDARASSRRNDANRCGKPNNKPSSLQWEFQAIFCGDIPLHRPYIGLIYGRYLQFRILKWPLIIGMIIVIIIALNDDDFRDNWGCLNNEGY
jgi:hypothetical protein